MAICPYLSTVAYDGSVASNFWAVCNEDGTVTINEDTKDCILWDFTNEKCGTKVTNSIADSSSNEQSVLISMLESVVGKQSEKDDAATGESILTIKNHEHDSHYHGYSHSCSDIPVSCGSRSLGFQSFPHVLMEELNSGNDKDGDGQAYGTDFRLSDDSCPPGLLPANRRLSFDLTERNYDTLKSSWES